MKLKALLYVDNDISRDIKPVLLEEDVEVYDFHEGEDILEEISKGYLNILFFSCFLTDDIGPSLESIRNMDPRLEIICIGNSMDAAMAIKPITLGAAACIGLPVDNEQIRDLVTKIKDHAQKRDEIYRIETALHEKYTFFGMVSRNPVMLDIFTLIKRIAPYYRTMLITGGTGTGKEVLARAAHDISPGAKEPFIVCNCSGLVENLIESELFGHVKGAFTGAITDKKGLFETAGKGTIVLDEIGDMPLSFQPHLLRVLQEGEFRRVGSTRTMKARCRVIAATNADLTEKVRMGEFREDLYFRLAVVTVHLPSLNERKEDIPLLYRFFLDKINREIGKRVRGITMDAKRVIMSHDWPGNIRELENIIESGVLVAPQDFIRLQDLPANLIEMKEKQSSADLSLESIERDHVKNVLLSSGGNQTKAADLLGISRRALSRKIEKYDLKH